MPQVPTPLDAACCLKSSPPVAVHPPASRVQLWDPAAGSMASVGRGTGTGMTSSQSSVGGSECTENEQSCRIIVIEALMHVLEAQAVGT
ncbi:hypothetical protein BRADI_4g36296v3 [Brachypodium distachyon]|uniref:Uncharacterized protein n=1 Tax=Brachypodium distachyon TaxID=15368 RepID=A0A2K2CSL4_BRADI|nr:hypothetical protein BRADI_4g36296v3 [Brachypodium distachyon]